MLHNAGLLYMRWKYTQNDIEPSRMYTNMYHNGPRNYYIPGGDLNPYGGDERWDYSASMTYYVKLEE